MFMECSSSWYCEILRVVEKCIDIHMHVLRRILFMIGGKGESCNHSREVAKEYFQ